MHSQLYKPIAKFWLLCIMWDLLCLGTTEASLDCSQLMNTQLLEKCCGSSKLANYIFKQTNCSSFLENYDPCRYDCLYKYWGLLNAHEQLHVENMNTMIKKLYGEGHEQSYGSAVSIAFKSCDRLISKYAEFIQLYSAQPVESNCALRALAYAKCVSINVFVNCPQQFWSASEQCDMAIQMANTCARMLNSMGAAADEPSKKDNPDMRSAAVGTRHKRRVKTYCYNVQYFGTSAGQTMDFVINSQTQ